MKNESNSFNGLSDQFDRTGAWYESLYADITRRAIDRIIEIKLYNFEPPVETPPL